MYAELLRDRQALTAELQTIVNTAEKEGREMTAAEDKRFDIGKEKLVSLNTQIENHISNFGVRIGEPGLPNAPRSADPKLTERLVRDLGDFYRGNVMASDSPLIIGSGGLAGTIPTSIMDRLSTYFNADPFQQAGATIYQTDDVNPLVKPIISAGAAPDAFSELQTSTDSHPMQVDSFTFYGDKYSRLVKVSEEALLNSALDLPGEITAELSAAVANGFTANITAALITALKANSNCVVDSSGLDEYGSILALINAVPPRWDDGTTCFMGSRAMRRLISDARASGTGAPLLNPVDGTVLGKRYIVNDNCTRLIYGNFRAGAYIRKSPYFVQHLVEAYASTGEQGFRATQWIDSHALAEVSTVTVQPLFETHLDTAGS